MRQQFRLLVTLILSVQAMRDQLLARGRPVHERALPDGDWSQAAAAPDPDSHPDLRGHRALLVECLESPA